MTITKLLNNLKQLTPEWNEYNYKVIGKTNKAEDPRQSVYISVSANNGRLIYVLCYRLDINFLSNCQAFWHNYIPSRDLQIFEKAIASNKAE